MLALESRVQLYIRFVTAFLFGSIAIPVLISLMTGSIEIGLGLSTVIIIVLTHILLAFRLISGYKLRKILFAITVLVVSLALITFKIWVNEIVIDQHLNFWGPSEFERNLNYICYFVWTTIVLWELVFYANGVITKRLKRE